MERRSKHASSSAFGIARARRPTTLQTGRQGAETGRRGPETGHQGPGSLLIPACVGILALVGQLVTATAAPAPAPAPASAQTRREDAEPVRLLLAVEPALLDSTSPSPGLWAEIVALADERLRPVLGRELQLSRTLSRSPSTGCTGCPPLAIAAGDRPREAGLDALLVRLLQAVQVADGELPVGVVPAPVARAAAPGTRRPAYRGVAAYEEGAVLLQVPHGAMGRSRRQSLAALLAHEVAHVFGGVHVEGGLMHPRRPAGELDPLNAAIVAAHASRDLAAGAGSERRGTTPELRRLYERALDVASDPPEVVLHLARLDLEDDRPAAAAALLEDLTGRQPQDLHAWLLLGIAHRRGGRYDDALRAYERVLERRPDDHRVHFNRGIALRHRGDVEAAIEAYARALELSPGFVAAMSNLAELELERGRLEQARSLLARALELAPGYRPARLNLARAELRVGDLAAATRRAERLVDAESDWAPARALHGVVLSQAGRWPEAAAELERAVGLDPASAEVHAELGYVRLMQGDAAAAEAASHAAVERDPSLARAWVNLGIVLAGRGDLHGAARRYRRAADADPRYVPAHLNLGAALIELGDPDAAMAAYRTALTAQPPPSSAARARLALALLHLTRGEVEAARQQARSARQLGADLPPALAGLLEKEDPDGM